MREAEADQVRGGEGETEGLQSARACCYPLVCTIAMPAFDRALQRLGLVSPTRQEAACLLPAGGHEKHRPTYGLLDHATCLHT